MSDFVSDYCCKGHSIIALPKEEQPKKGDLILYCTKCHNLFIEGQFEGEYWRVRNDDPDE